MYFEIENTPEHIRKARRAEVVKKSSPKEECPRLILAPFTKPPQVVFENVIIGSTTERTLEVLNPAKHIQQICLGKALPPGLVIHLPDHYLTLEPQTCYSITLQWTPLQPTALRETIRFCNENRGRYDIIVVLKSAMNVKTKQKVNKTSPGKITKKNNKNKKSPSAIDRKKVETMYKTTNIKRSSHVVESPVVSSFYKSSNKENIPTIREYETQSQSKKCPFDSPISIEFNTSEIFSNIRKIESSPCLQTTYDKSMKGKLLPDSQNILRPFNGQTYDANYVDVFDNLTFTPLKSVFDKNEKHEKRPKNILSLNSESELNDSLNFKHDKEHPIICITSYQAPNKWLGVTNLDIDSQYMETPTMLTKKVPNTSSPKELSSPNFSINTELSRISDLSFHPQRFSTERKFVPKLNCDSHCDFIDDGQLTLQKFSSDTYTKESLNPQPDPNVMMISDNKVPNFFMKEQSKMCRQSLFREYQLKEISDQNYSNARQYENIWQNLRTDTRSPPRSLTPPLQSIPEESIHLHDTQILNKTDKQMNTFTINRTFDKSLNKTSINKLSWSKKAITTEPELWKIPSSKKSLKSKKQDTSSKNTNLVTHNESNDSIKNVSLNHFGNVYSQSLTLDPFLSTTYFYDEKSVDKIEVEFKRWLNYILTPPADLDSNVEYKVDYGKAWIENRTKDIPAAPTKEQVSNKYHNSHRLESLRRSARSLLLSPEIQQVLAKLHLQIDKKLIAIRNDRNLHLDVGLQKIIMELLVSYNPLWLRIGLEAVYGTVLPLKSNSDVEGLTIFIIQRMFKNPYLKGKHSKSNAPNMLLPAYMEAIKKHTLKKFFALVFFLDQAKQKKLISHDPCLFCRNAICKESREIVIRFTRELIAGIGDITKHLRPLGYIVSHKQLYLDEFKYAVHNIAADIRDGVRLTKVMEIILIKDGLLKQLRTPAISRLQKIHNMQVVLNALKEADFEIVGEISATDIADGHREKTLSLLWQIIHVFRAPLFVKAANVIQSWWRKKYEVIIEKRKKEELLIQKQNNAACKIQYWWRKIQYNRVMEWKMQQLTRSTVIIQKYFRRWLCQSRFQKFKTSVNTIEDWYKAVKMINDAKKQLDRLKLERENLINQSAIVLQSYVRRWLSMKRYRKTISTVILLQSKIRSYIARKYYLRLKWATGYVQSMYKGKLLMRKEMKEFSIKRHSAIIIQSYFKMVKIYKYYQNLKNAVKIIEMRYKCLLKMRYERSKYLELRINVVRLQACYRRKIAHKDYTNKREAILKIQTQIRAYFLMKKERASYLQVRSASIILQRYIRAYLEKKKERQRYLNLRNSTIMIQQYFRSKQLTKSQKASFIRLRLACIIIQNRFRSLINMRKERSKFLNYKSSIICIQRRYRAKVLMKEHKDNYNKLRTATITVQRIFRANKLMFKAKKEFMELKNAVIKLQNAYRTYKIGRIQRESYLETKRAAIKIQQWLRNLNKTIQVKKQYEQSKRACVSIQRFYKSYVIGKQQRQEYLKIRTATICIQKYYRSYIQTRSVRQEYVRIKTATVKIQRFYQSYKETKKQTEVYVRIKNSVVVIQRYYRRYQSSKRVRDEFCKMKMAAICLQRRFRSVSCMKKEKQKLAQLKKAVVLVQRKYRALIAMREKRELFIKLRSAAVVIQRRLRAHYLMKLDRKKYLQKLKSCIFIQRYYRQYKHSRIQREEFLKLKHSAITLQRRYKALIIRRKERANYLKIRNATIFLQRKLRANLNMIKERENFLKIKNACVTIQRYYRAYVECKAMRKNYVTLKMATAIIQKQFRAVKKSKTVRRRYLRIRKATIVIQRYFRRHIAACELKRNESAKKIQIWYRSVKMMKECRENYFNLKHNIILIQSTFRGYENRKKFTQIKNATLTIQSFYRHYKLAQNQRKAFLKSRNSVIKLQACVRRYVTRRRYLKIRSVALTIQAVYRFKKLKKYIEEKRCVAAICIQKNVKRFLIESWYKRYHSQVLFVQKLWKGKLLTRLLRFEFTQKIITIVKIQAAIKGHLLRKGIKQQKENIRKLKEEQRLNWAASKIQALFKGHHARVKIANDKRVTEIRRRWREGALESFEPTIKERHDEVMEVLLDRQLFSIDKVIKTFRSLELLTEVFPMTYNDSVSIIVQRVYFYMMVTNRSISSVEVLKYGAAVLVNLTRYKVTGPKIYQRERIPPILKFMWRFSNTEVQLFCIMATYLWLFSKYENIKEDLIECFNSPENHKMLLSIKDNVNRMKRMTNTTTKNKSTPQLHKFMSRTPKLLLPALDPDYGIVRANKPRYFEDAQHAINCLFSTFQLNERKGDVGNNSVQY